MAWLAVHKNGGESIFYSKPKREQGFWVDELPCGDMQYDSEISLPNGTIKKIIGIELTWNDEPVNLFGLRV